MTHPCTQPSTRTNLLGKGTACSAEDVEAFSAEKHVTRDTPRAFIVHAADDTLVQSANSELYASALQAKSVACKYIELPSGGHGQCSYAGLPSDCVCARACVRAQSADADVAH